jgi:RHS repeat-associated protein
MPDGGARRGRPGPPKPSDRAETPFVGAAVPPSDEATPFALEPTTIGLPKGGGALRGIDEQFAVNASNGTATLSLSLPFTPSRDGFVPPVRLGYDVGAGNGVFGIGWKLDVPSVRRRTDRAIPTYSDTDTYSLGGGDDLVPVFEWDGVGWVPPPMPGSRESRRYRPRIERDFARIERVTSQGAGTWWRVTSRQNVTTFYGYDETSRIADPDDSTRVLEWLPSFSFDDRGNCLVYEYVPEDIDGVADGVSEANRHRGTARFGNRHLKRLRYGNRTPYEPDADDPLRPGFPGVEFMFEAVFDFGEHDSDNPGVDPPPGITWPARADPFSWRRGGFELRTYRLVRRVLMFHRFADLTGGAPTLVRSLDLGYDDDPECCHLVTVTMRGYLRRPDGTLSTQSLPPVEIAYEPMAWDDEIHAVEPDSTRGLPAGAGTGYQWMDLWGEGISGLFTEQGGAWWFKRNLGIDPGLGQARFDTARLVAPRPSLSGMATGALQVQDLENDGRRQVVVRTADLDGYYQADGDGGWLPFEPFDATVRIDLQDRHVRLLDLIGDGRAHLLVSEQDVFVWYRSVGRRGYEPGGRVAATADEERGPAIVFADATESIFFADMSGDGLVDIVRIRNGDVCYWPNLGYGRFGDKVTMEHAPEFATDELFDPGRLRLADLSGTGVADVLYLDADGVAAYVNCGGNGFAAPRQLAAPFSSGPGVEFAPADLLGTGTTCLVWSSRLPGDTDSPMRYIDPTAGRKPHLLTGYRTNLGKEVTLTHTSSTWHYLQSEREGRPWRTRLPFPVHCVRRVDVVDRVRGTRLVTEYRYHHGYYDAGEREFRGFGMVEQLDTGTTEHAIVEAGSAADRALHPPPTLTRLWFHTGVDLGSPSPYSNEHWDAELRRHGFEIDAHEPALVQSAFVAEPVGAVAATADTTRARKGATLRSELFGLDAPADVATEDERRRELTPFSVVERASLTRVFQPPIGRYPAVVAVFERETITRAYERDAGDPRVEQIINVRVDEVGNVVESAIIHHGRRVADGSLPASAQALQGRSLISYVTEEYTADVITSVHHRLRLPSRRTTYELRGLQPASELFAVSDFDRDGFHALTDSLEESDLDVEPPPGAVLRRLLTRSDTLYLDETLAAPLPLHQMAATALPYERYEMAFTAEMVADRYGGRVDDALMVEGGYVHRGDADWWVPSGRHVHLRPGDDAADARSRFLVAVGHVDGRGVATRYGHHGGTWLVVEEIEDAAGNVTTATEFDWRSLAPSRVVDSNGNESAVLFDELCRVKAAALVGKGDGDSLAGLTPWTTDAEAADVAAFLAAVAATEVAGRGADLLGAASSRHVYDPHAFAASGGVEPPRVATITREQRAAVQLDSPVQVAFEYSNGRGDVELHKVQAEPGPAKQITVNGDGTVTVADVDTAALQPPQLRWLGNGRRVADDKGNVVKEYQPFFSLSHRYESATELVATGVAVLRTHDALGRPVHVDHPDGSFAKTEPEAWCTLEHDRNDTVASSEWHQRRVDHLIDAELLASGRDPAREEEAAVQTEEHNGTPFSRHLDPRGRPIVELHHNGLDAGGHPVLHATVYRRDIEGRTKAIVDAREIETIGYRYDLRGATVGYTSRDGGSRWMLADVRGEPLRSWDQRGHEFVFEYDDPLRRCSAKRVVGGDGPTPLDHVYERRVYGETVAGAVDHNLRTRIAVQYDTAGKVENRAFDLAGNLVASARRFRLAYRTVADWSGPTAGLDAAVDVPEYRSTARYDALGRVAERTAADGSLYQPIYNAANLLETITVTQHEGPEIHVKDIDYDELGRRRRIVYGNDVELTADYDPETFRLLRLTTRDPGGTPIQDLHYTYDPMGNATHLDDACVPTVWFDNHMVDGLSRYWYDPRYRLVEASGREHVAQAGPGPADNWSDDAFGQGVGPNDALAWRAYTDHYHYDPVGNITTTVHQAGPGSWRREYTSAADSNRLVSTAVGDTVYAYQHHPTHGHITAMPHLPTMRWNFRDELHAIASQVVASGTPEMTWYAYDADGHRVRKVTDRAAAAGADPVPRRDRIYLDGVEIALEFDNAGDATIERRTFHVMDGVARVALIERESDPGAAVPDAQRTRYQSPDQLGSSHLETDEDGTVISYEVFHPFGTTAYQATVHTLGSAARRYRYTAMERDDETGFTYHGARFYAPWLGRWTAPDEHPDQYDGNRYAYVKNNPLAFRDPNGLFEEPVHGALTYRLAIAAGFSQRDAATIAIAAAGMDHEAAYRPGDGLIEMQKQILIGRTQHYHYPTQGRALARIDEDIALGVPDLVEFGRHLHSLEDVGFSDAPGPHNRSPVRLLGPTVATVAAAAVGIGAALSVGASAAFKAGGGWSFLGALAVAVAIAAFAFALYGFVFAIVGAGTGHPTYLTEGRKIDGTPKPRLLSSFWSHAADRAFEDPQANTAELLRVYGKLKEAALAANPAAVADDAAARAAIRETVAADTSDRVNELFNAPVRDSRANVVAPSYSEIRRSAPWRNRPPDVSLSEGDFVYDPNRQLQGVP